MSVPPINLDKLESLAYQLQRQGVGYGLGAKAPSLSAPPQEIHQIDCSGFVRYILYQATDGALTLPDGSQNQRAWAESNLREVQYIDAAHYITDRRLFICFIKPFANGCGNVGHVWLLRNGDDNIGAETIESHGGAGVNFRRWNTAVLYKEVYSCFELPTLEEAQA